MPKPESDRQPRRGRAPCPTAAISEVDNQLFAAAYAAVPLLNQSPMLVCQCNVITDREIRAVIRALLDEDPWAIVVPARVYRALAKRCKCAGCVPNVVDIITAVTEEYHRELTAEATAAKPGPRRMPARKKGGRHEGRGPGHRAAQ